MSSATRPAQPVIGRTGAMIGLFTFIGSLTATVALGVGRWWANDGGRSASVGYLAVALGAAVLTLLPRWPVATFVATGVLAFLLYGLGVPLGLPTLIMALVALFGVTLWTDRRTGLWALVTSLAAVGLAVLLLAARYGTVLPRLHELFSDRVAVNLLNGFGLVVLVWAVADQIRSAQERRALEEESETHAAQAAEHQAAERTARGEVAALADRQRIAREMHDIVAHGLSVMIVQADGARFAATTDPEAATAALATISATGRSSLAEMRRLLSVLRDETAPLPEAPQPGLRDVPALVASLTDAGRTVHLHVAGDLDDAAVSDLVGLTAYRTVQESLTNVIKHAGDEATAWVTLEIGPGRVLVEVLDDGTDPEVDGRPAPPTGHGLRGMAERVEIVGGQLVTGPDPRGGFRVLATIPLDAHLTVPLQVQS